MAQSPIGKYLRSGRAFQVRTPYQKHFHECIQEFAKSCPTNCRVLILDDDTIEIYDRSDKIYRGPIEDCDAKIGAIRFKLSDQQIDLLIALRVMDS